MATLNERELTIAQWGKLKPPGASLHHGGKDNQCVGNGQHVFRCFDCEHWCCECCGSDDEKPDEPLCDDCWCKRNGAG